MALSFAIKLTDQVSPDARKAAGSLQSLQNQITSEGAALKSLESQMRTMQRSSSVSLDTFKQLSGAISAQKDKLSGLTEEMVKSGGAGFVPATVKSRLLSFGMKELERNAGLSRRAISAIGPEGLALAAALSAVAISAVVAVGAIVAVGGAVVFLESKLISLGVAASEAKGDITRSLELLYGSEKAAEHTYKVLESLTQGIAISQGRVMELADTLIKAGQVNGDAMVRSIETIGKAEAARAGAGKVLEGVITRATSSRIFSVSRTELMAVGLSYKQLSAEVAKGIGTTSQEAELRLRTGGVRVKEGLEALGRVVDAKMGDLANKKFQTVGVQTQRLHDNFMRLFEGVDTGPFARLLMVIANQLDESSVSGAALRTIVKSAFDEISSAAERVAPYVQAFFEGAILLALKLYNALYPVRKAIANLFGGADAGGLEKTQDTIIAVANNIAAAFGYAAISLAYVINHAKDLAKALDMIAQATPGVSVAYNAVRSGIALLTSSVGNDKETGAEKKGKNVADGVAAGVTAGTPAVEAAMAAMAAKGQKAFDDKLGIKSPSKVMQLSGRNTVDGVTKGINDGAKGPAFALERATAPMVQAANDGSGAAQSPRGTITGRSKDGTTVHVVFQAGAIVIGGGQNARDAEEQLTQLMANVFEKAAATQGAG